MAKKNGLDNKEQLLAGAIMLGFGLMYSVNKQLTAHMLDCSMRSATVSKIGYGILIIVAAGLLLNGINAYHTTGDTSQRIERTVEETHKK
jgi:hypothetical protein